MVGGLVFIIVAVAYFFYGLQPTFRADAVPVAFTVSRGEGFRDIAGRLSDAGLIRSLSVFKIYSFLTGTVQKFQPGIYELDSTMSVRGIVRTLTEPGGNEVEVTVPEGATVRDVDLMLARAGVLSEGALLEVRSQDFAMQYPFLADAPSMEGFFFPDTYRFERGAAVAAVAERFLDAFREKAWPMLEGRRNWYGALTLASILEREVPEFEDRRLVAGLLMKRLDKGMLLQVDAALSYAKCNGRFLECVDPGVRRADLGIASPYNTYRRPGLTPTPIANPGVLAVRAATEPLQSPYWYYLSAEETKKTIFSKTLDEHNANRGKYL